MNERKHQPPKEAISVLNFGVFFLTAAGSVLCPVGSGRQWFEMHRISLKTVGYVYSVSHITTLYVKNQVILRSQA